MKIGTIKKRLLASMFCAGAVLVLTGTAAQAAVIYTETFENPNASTKLAVQDFGWTAYQNNGTDLSGSTGDPMYGNINDYIFVGSANAGNQFAMISAAGSVDPAAYENDLAFTFNSWSTDDGNNSAGLMGYRVLATVGSTIYASDFINATAASTLKGVTVADTVWHAWTGETDLTDGFDIANIDGTATTLAAGSISDIGVMVIDHETRDRFRFDDFSITGTVIPEPATMGLVAAFGGGILFIRRRFMI